MDTNIKSGRHLYGRGWLGLIPLVGAFVGLGLILLGLFKYKDKKLVGIGIAALLFTVSIYGYMFYDLRYGTNRINFDYQTSQERLNNLPKQIELYKMQFGQYPDNLEQINNSDKSLDVIDPLLLRKMERNKKVLYLYKKVGENYIISSAGLDGIPNNSDDLYPMISPNDKLKYGLLNRR